MSAGRKTNRLFSFIIATLLFIPNIAFADLKLNLTEGVTSISQQAYDLHMLVLWIVTIVGIAVFAVIIYSLIYHRKSKGAVAAQFHESTTVEVIWTIVPLVVLVLIAIPATKTLLYIEDASNPDITIKVTGWQWKWQYEYLDEGINFFSNLDAKSNEARQRNSGVDVRTVEHYLLDVDKFMRLL
jgi:cytochrome c oxidase subunit 2